MERQHYRLAAIITALTLTASLSSAARPATLTVVLHVTDFASTDDGNLGRARTEAQRIFGDVGVRLAWVDIALGPEARACEGLNLFVSLLSPFLIEQHTLKGVSSSVLGTASPAAGHAFIFGERIRTLAERRRIDEGVLLGRVMAHEIGHLLLPGARHSRTGLMTAGMDTDPVGLTTFFLSPERRAIRARLESRALNPQDRAECGTDTVARER